MTPASAAATFGRRVVACGVLPALVVALACQGWHWQQQRADSLRAWSEAGVSIGWQPSLPWPRVFARWPQGQALLSPHAPNSLTWPITQPSHLPPGRELELALRCRSLQRLEGPTSLLTAPDWTRWSGESPLETIVLSNGLLEPAAVTALARLPNLKHLVCRDVRVAPGTLRELARSVSLASLEFQFCDVPAEEWEALQAANLLQRLELIGSTLPDQAWGRLQAALPHLRIADD